MSTYTVLRFLHILSAIWFIAGILGRQPVMAAAGKKDDLRLVARLSQASAPCARISTTRSCAGRTFLSTPAS